MRLALIDLSNLKALETPVTDEQTCDDAYPGMITNSMLCFGYGNKRSESCKIGEGDPVVCDGELQGLFSWDNTEWVCGDSNGPGVYARVCIFTQWIQDSTAKYWKEPYNFQKI